VSSCSRSWVSAARRVELLEDVTDGPIAQVEEARRLSLGLCAGYVPTSMPLRMRNCAYLVFVLIYTNLYQFHLMHMPCFDHRPLAGGHTLNYCPRLSPRGSNSELLRSWVLIHRPNPSELPDPIVIDVLNGPLGSTILNDPGARVIKICPPGHGERYASFFSPMTTSTTGSRLPTAASSSNSYKRGVGRLSRRTQRTCAMTRLVKRYQRAPCKVSRPKGVIH
jgi:hypothetical protein